MLADAEGSYFPDNDERASLLRPRACWRPSRNCAGPPPSCIATGGSTAGVVPVYLKRVFADDPIFRDVKVVVSLYGDGFPGELHPGFGAKIAVRGSQR